MQPRYKLFFSLLCFWPVCASAAEDCPAAAKLLAKAERLQPSHASVLPLLDKAARLCPSLASVHFMRGVVLYESGKLTEARSEFSRALKGSEEPRFSNGLGIVYLAEEDFEAAKKQFLKTLELQEDNVDALQGIAVVHFEQGAYGESARALQRALQIKTDSGELFLNLAIVLEADGNLQDAKQSYLSALEREPNLYQANLGLAQVHLSLGELAEAQANLSAVLASKELGLEALLTQAALFDARGEYAKALEALKKARKLGDDPKRNNYNRGLVLAKKGQLGQAKQLLEKIAADPSADPAMRNGLAWFYVQTEQWELAREALLELTASTEADGFAFYYLGLVYEALGDRSNAKTAFEKATELNPNEAVFARGLESFMSKEEG